jgi:hypothetical protein
MSAAARPSANGAPTQPPAKPAAGRRDGEDGRSPTIYRRERSTGRILAVVFGAIVVLVAVVVVLASVLSKGSSTGSGNGAGSSTASSHAARKTSTAIEPRSLRVVVLNATQTNGLAGKVASTLKSHGYGQAAALYGTPSGSYSSTTVQYAEGHAAEAREVASALKVPTSEVQPISSSVAPLSGGAPVTVVIGGSGTEGSGSGSEEKTGNTEGQAGGETAGGGEVGSESQAAEPGA